jgi:choline dehydrogenase
MTETYDYIIVGAGSAGCAVAARLSEKRDIRVLLLEAGPRDSHPFLKMPLAFLEAGKLDRYVQRLQSEPEPQLGGRRIAIPRGRTLGGSSSINGMVYARGDRRDYDDWRDMGFAGWGYDDVLPLFRRMEASWRGATPFHGHDGPVGVSKPDVPAMGYAALAEAAVAAGHRVNSDPGGEHADGISAMELTVRKGARASASAAYLTAARARSNLTIRTGALIGRVVIKAGRATGVEYRSAGQSRTVHAGREVILSAGAYGSPQILMLSGIGAADELCEAGVAPVHDLPGVGSNLAEHPLAHLGFLANHGDTFLKELRYDRAARSIARWLLLRDGPFATNGVGANLYLRTRPELDRADVKLVCGTIGLDAALWFPGITRPPVHRYTCGVSLLRSHSRGWVRLASADPAAPPRIHFNLLDDPADLRALVAGVKAARALYAQPSMASQIQAEATPGPEIRTDAELEAHIRATAGIGHHPAGTCAMGAVVDGRLRVLGVDGLRVADASIMPQEVSGNINVPVMMIGEKAADLIAEDS